MAYFTLLLALIFSEGAWANTYDNRPYLYLDGKRLADYSSKIFCSDPRTLDFKNYRHFSPLSAGLKAFSALPLDQNQTFSQLTAVRDWILQQPDESILPHMLLQRAVIIMDGNVLEGLRLVYNLLSEGARHKETFLKRSLSAKLIDITGEQKLARAAYQNILDKKVDGIFKPISSRGGKSSAWYHLFGTAMIAFDEGIKKPPASLSCNLGAANAQLMGRIVGHTMVTLENIFDKYIMQTARLSYYVDNDKRALYNREGVEFGARLAANILRLKNSNSICDITEYEKPYLYDNKEIYGKDYPLRPGERPNHFKR